MNLTRSAPLHGRGVEQQSGLRGLSLDSCPGRLGELRQHPHHCCPVGRPDLRQLRRRGLHPDAQRSRPCALRSGELRRRTRPGAGARSGRRAQPLCRHRRRLHECHEFRGNFGRFVRSGRHGAAQHRGARSARRIAIGADERGEGLPAAPARHARPGADGPCHRRLARRQELRHRLQRRQSPRRRRTRRKSPDAVGRRTRGAARHAHRRSRGARQRMARASSVETLSLDNQAQATREIDVADGRRIVALRRVQGWPLAVAASSRVGEALDAWYGSLPLYFFVIFGPALAGAGLAVIFVREFERRARTTEAVKNLRATKPEQARLLVRLADAERRAVEAERARREFVGHMSHELRTPLNAIIGFSEVIERGVFGQHRKYSEYARDIGLAGRELHGKIGDILDFANLEGRKSAPVSAPIDIVPIVRQVVDEAIPAARAKGVRLSVSLPMVAEAAADTTRRAPHPLQPPAQRDAIFAVRRHDPAAGEKHCRCRDGQCARSGPWLFHDRTRARGRSLLPLRSARLHHRRRHGSRRRHALARGMGGTLRLASVQGESTTAELRLAKK